MFKKKEEHPPSSRLTRKINAARVTRKCLRNYIFREEKGARQKGKKKKKKLELKLNKLHEPSFFFGERDIEAGGEKKENESSATRKNIRGSRLACVQRIPICGTRLKVTIKRGLSAYCFSMFLKVPPRGRRAAGARNGNRGPGIILCRSNLCRAGINFISRTTHPSFRPRPPSSRLLACPREGKVRIGKTHR